MTAAYRTRRTSAATRRPALPKSVPADLPGWAWAQNRSGEVALLAPGGESTPWFVQDAEARSLAAARSYQSERPHLVACREQAASVAQLGWVARALPGAGWELHERGTGQVRVFTDDAGLRAAVGLLQAAPRPSVVELWEALRASGAAAELVLDGVAEAARRVAWSATDLPAELHARLVAAGYRQVAAERDDAGVWRHLVIHAAVPTHSRRWGTVAELRQFLAALGLECAETAGAAPEVTPGVSAAESGAPAVPAEAPTWQVGPDAQGVYRRPPGLPELQEVAPGDLVPGWCQPRQRMDPTALDGLATSLREHGQLDDVLTFADADERGGWCLRLIAGHRRRAAALQAGLPMLRVRVVEATALQIDLMALASNDKRADLTDLERGRHYARMQQQHGLTTVELAQRLGETRTVVSQRLMLTRLAPEVQEALEQQQISFSQARGLHEGSAGDHAAQRDALASLLADLAAGERRGEAEAKALARVAFERQVPEHLSALGWRMLPWDTATGEVLLVGAPAERPACWTPEQVREVVRAGRSPAAGAGPESCRTLEAARTVFARRGWAEVDAGGLLAPWVVLATPELRVLHPDEVAGAVAEAQADLDALVEQFAAAGWRFWWAGAEMRWRAERADALTVGGKGYAMACERLATILSWVNPRGPVPSEEAPSIATAVEAHHADSPAASAALPVEAAPASELPRLPAQLARLGCALVEPEPGLLAVLGPDGEEIDRQPAKHRELLLDAVSREMLVRAAAGHGLHACEPAGDLHYRLCQRGYGWRSEPLRALEALDWLEQAGPRLAQEAQADPARWARLARLCAALGAPAEEASSDPRQASYGRLVHPALPEQVLTLPELIDRLSAVVARQALDQLAQLPATTSADLAALRDRIEALFGELNATVGRAEILPPPWDERARMTLSLAELAAQVAAWEQEARVLAGVPAAQVAPVEPCTLPVLVTPDAHQPTEIAQVAGAIEPPPWASAAGAAWAQLLSAPDAAAAAQAALRLALQLAGAPVEVPTRGRSALRQQILDLGGQVLRGDGADARPDGLWVVAPPRWVVERRGQPLHDNPRSLCVEIEPGELADWVGMWPEPPQDWRLDHQLGERASAARDALREGDPAQALRHLLAAVGAVVEAVEPAPPADAVRPTALEFGVDRKVRCTWFTTRSFEHPAKLHLGLLDWLIQHHQLAGRRLCDPMGGIGSTLYAATYGCSVDVYDVEPPWLEIAQANVAHIAAQAGGPVGAMTVRHHDARQPWPGQGYEVILFSPPYGCDASSSPLRRRALSNKIQTMAQDGTRHRRWRALAKQLGGGAHASLLFHYGEAEGQIGHLRGQRYWAAMEPIYRNAHAALVPGGQMILILKDHIRRGRRVAVVEQTIRLCERLGFVLTARHQRLLSPKDMALWTRRRAERGEPVVTEEDVLVFRRADVPAQEVQ